MTALVDLLIGDAALLLTLVSVALYARNYKRTFLVSMNKILC